MFELHSIYPESLTNFRYMLCNSDFHSFVEDLLTSIPFAYVLVSGTSP